MGDRDFTINAMALPATAQFLESVIDPTGGLDALKKKELHLTIWESPDSLERDPIRALRAIRQRIGLGFSWSEKLHLRIRHTSLKETSIERVRDEFLKMMTTAVPDEAIYWLHTFGLFAQFAPELVNQISSEPDESNQDGVNMIGQTAKVWRPYRQLEKMMLAEVDADKAMADLLADFKPYQAQIQKRWEKEVDGGINGRILLRLGLLFHQVGENQEFVNVQPSGNEKIAAQISEKRLRKLAFSNQAIGTVKNIILYQNHLFNLAKKYAPKEITRRVAYRYFRDTQDVGIDVGIVTVAIYLTQFNRSSDLTLLRTVSILFKYFFEQYAEVIDPPLLINGRELMQQLNLTPGPEIGRLLRLIKEEQAAGFLKTAEEALHFARQVSN